jgi:hypothetical protein
MWTEAPALIVLLLGVTLACGQSRAPDKKSEGTPKAPAKSALEEALSEALKNNPDLRVASAKLQEAEAELFRARLRVVQNVVAQQRAAEQARAAVKLASQELERMSRNKGAIPEVALRRAEAKLAEAKAALAGAESELAYLLGKAPRAGEKVKAGELLQLHWSYRRFNLAHRARVLGQKFESPPAPVKGAMADKVRKALDRKVNYKFESLRLDEVVKAFQKDNPGIHFQLVFPKDSSERVTATLTDVPFRAALQLLADSVPDYRIAVRDYGLLIAPKDKLPPGAVLLDDFGKGEAKADKKPAK